MIERVSLINSNKTTLVNDSDLSLFELWLTGGNGGVLFSDMGLKEEFDLTVEDDDILIDAGNAIIPATRATSIPITNQKVALRYYLSDTKTLTGTGTKIFIEIEQTLIDDPTLIEDIYPSTDYALGKNIGELKRADERPTNPHIKLWEYDGAWIDLRNYPKVNGDKLDIDYVVRLTGDQTIEGVKTFISSPVVPTPTTDMQASTKKYVDDNIATATEQHKLTNSDFMTGEDLVEGDSIFREEAITFAEVNQSQNIGDVAGHTRVSVRAIGSGTAGNTLKLSLAKVVSPSVNLGIRIETDNAGKPSGELVDANATATVTEASLTTSLADTTVTLAGSITIPKGTVVHIVLFQGTYGSETVNATNYYKVGYNINKNTTTRYGRNFDGTNWYEYKVVGTNQADGTSGGSFATSITSETFSIRPFNNVYLTTISQQGVTGRRRARIYKLSGESIIDETRTVDHFLTPFTFNILLKKGEEYFVYMDDGVGYRHDGMSKTEVNIEIIGPIRTRLTFNSQIINTRPNSMFYVDSGFLYTTLYSKTDARYTYKLPDIPRIATANYSTGQIPKRDFKGISKHLTGLTKGTELFVANTPGALSTTAGLIGCKIGNVIDSDELLLNRKVQNFRIKVGTSPFTWTNTTNNPVQIKITGGTVNSIVIDGVTVATATDHINTVPAGKAVVITYSGAPTVVYSDI